MFKYIFAFLCVIGFGWMMWHLVQGFYVPDTMNELADSYVSGSVNELKIPNTVTAVVVSYRGLDTLGEVTVLFLATVGVGFFLKRNSQGNAKRREGSEILKTGASFLAPMIMLFGIYVFTHGHLTPGGGFQGGVLIASATLLIILACPACTLPKHLIRLLEGISGLGYVFIGILGLLILSQHSFLNPRILGVGEWQKLFSGGAIPVIYSLIGLKVGSELSSVLGYLKGGGEES